MTSHYRRSDYANLLFISGILTFIAAVADLIVKPGDAIFFKTVVVIFLFTLSALLLVASLIVNTIGDSVSITNRLMTIQSYKQFIFISDEFESTGRTLPRHRKVLINLSEIENFAAFDGRELYEHSFHKHYPMHLKMRPMIVDSFIGDMLISLVKVAPGHISTHYDRDAETLSEDALNESNKALLMDCRFFVINMKDKRQIIFFLKGYDMIDTFSILSHMVKKSHMLPISPVKYPEMNYKMYHSNKWHRVFFSIWISIIPTILLVSLFLFIQPEPNGIFYYASKMVLMSLSSLFGLRIYLLHSKAFYRSKMKHLGVTISRSNVILSIVDFALLVTLMVLTEILLFVING